MEYADFSKLPQKAKIDCLFVELGEMRIELSSFFKYIRISLALMAAIVPLAVFVLSQWR